MSTKSAAAEVAPVPAATGFKTASEAGYPVAGYSVEYAIAAVFTVRKEPTAEASFAAMRERSKFGIAIAAIIKMMATTIRSQ